MQEQLPPRLPLKTIYANQNHLGELVSDIKGEATILNYRYSNKSEADFEKEIPFVDRILLCSDIISIKYSTIDEGISGLV